MSPEALAVEPDQVPRRLALRVILVTVCLGLGLAVVTHLLLEARETRLPTAPASERALGPPREIAGVLQEPFGLPHPRPTVRQQQAALLRSYGWVDRAQGLVRIPIDRAIDLAVGPEEARQRAQR